jgi:hypothetical protein
MEGERKVSRLFSNFARGRLGESSTTRPEHRLTAYNCQQ